VPPRASLILTRLLRAHRLAPIEGVNPTDLLDVKEPPTVRRLLGMINGANNHNGSAMAVASFLEGQSVVTAALPLRSLRRLIAIDFDSRSGTCLDICAK
jgi:hypothetical protein